MSGQENTNESETPQVGVAARIDQYLLNALAKLTSRDFRIQAIWALGSIILALIASAIIMVMSGYDPGAAYYNLFMGAIGQPDRILFYATPLILAGLSVAVAFKCGLFNIGAEGQVYMGSIAATVVGYMIALPILVHPIVCLIVGAGMGMVWGLIPGLLRAYRGAHEVVTTMMLSYTAITVTTWLVTYPLKEQGEYAWVSQTPRLYDTALLPNIFGPYLHWGLLVAILAVVAVDFLINRTILGYELRAVGQNEEAAEYGGINSKRNMALALGISGGLAGLAGAEEIMGTYGRFTANWSPGLGWDGITVAVLGHNNPWGCLAGAIFFGALKAGGNTMHQIAHVPIEMVGVIQGLIVLFIAAPRIISWILGKMGIQLQATEDEVVSIDYSIKEHNLRIQHTSPGTVLLGNKLEISVFYDGEKKIGDIINLSDEAMIQAIDSGQTSYEFSVDEDQESVTYRVLVASVPTVEVQEKTSIQVFRNGIPLEEFIAEIGGAQ
ncbi:MAG: ABC transporter permease [Candidatus Thorarchaeota archaeon]|jgi:simple sugar transport system permease protein